MTLKFGSVLWLSGASTLHPYASTATQMNLTAEISLPQAAPIGEILKPGVLKTLILDIPVAGLKSGESGLDKNMRSSLKAKDCPSITFSLDSYQTAADPAAQGSAAIKALGKLTIAGKTNPVDLDMQASPEGKDLRIRGSKTLLMTDFGIKPPTMFFGALKVRNPVTIHFELLLSRESGDK